MFTYNYQVHYIRISMVDMNENVILHFIVYISRETNFEVISTVHIYSRVQVGLGITCTICAFK